jgi:hypothetical protein
MLNLPIQPNLQLKTWLLDYFPLYIAPPEVT